MESERPGCVLHRRGTRGPTLPVVDMPRGTPRRSTFRRGPAQPAAPRLRAAWEPSMPGSDTPPRRSRRGCPWLSWWPSRHRPVEVEQDVVVAQPALFDLGVLGWSDDVEAVAPQLLGGLDMG